MAEERKTTKSSEMRNVQLSELTKEFLVAHRMVQEAGEHALAQFEEFWGGPLGPDNDRIEEVSVPLWAAVDQLQDLILELMTEVISEKLKGLKVTEI